MSACKHLRVRPIRRVYVRRTCTLLGDAWVVCTACGATKSPRSDWWIPTMDHAWFRPGAASELLMFAITGRRRVSIAKARCDVDTFERRTNA